MSIGGLGDPINSTSDYLDSKYKRGDVLFLVARRASSTRPVGASRLPFPP